MIICGDIGGTHARLAVADLENGVPQHARDFLSADYDGLAPILAAYLAETGIRPTGGCLAVAGPVSADGWQARLTNLPWVLDADDLAQSVGMPSLTLANDFAAAAMGVGLAPPDTLTILQPGEPLATAPRLVVGAGTGLGMAVLIWQAGRWQVVPGEGGHIAFAPQDDLQEQVWRGLRAEYGRVTAERVISGAGLVAIHRILNGETLTPAEIGRRAMAENNEPARTSLNVFLAAYGAYAGDMALAVMARGGVYLAGGIMPRLLSVVRPSPFLSSFNDKAEHADIVRQMSVTVVADPVLGLRGAAYLAGATQT